jgi:hypothetical protein
MYVVMDKGLYPHQAEALSEDGKNRVLYHTPYETRDPHFKDYVVGKGFGHLEKILYPEDYYARRIRWSFSMFAEIHYVISCEKYIRINQFGGADLVRDWKMTVYCSRNGVKN